MRYDALRCSPAAAMRCAPHHGTTIQTTTLRYSPCQATPLLSCRSTPLRAEAKHCDTLPTNAGRCCAILPRQCKALPSHASRSVPAFAMRAMTVRGFAHQRLTHHTGAVLPVLCATLRCGALPWPPVPCTPLLPLVCRAVLCITGQHPALLPVQCFALRCAPMPCQTVHSCRCLARRCDAFPAGAVLCNALRCAPAHAL